MTFLTKMLRLQLGLLKPIVDNFSLETIRRGQDALGELMAKIHQSDVTYEPVGFENFNALWVHPNSSAGDGVIFYLHGGGYIGGDLEYAKGFATTLAAETGLSSFCIGYRLAPEHPFPAALDDALESYKFLLSSGVSPEKLVLAGESAGGGLIYCLCEKLRQESLPLPAGLIAISPWTDLTASGKSYEVNREKDPSISAELLGFYADCYASDRTDPLVSPLFGDMTGMPPSIIFVGGDEVMMSDAALMHEKLLASGCRSRLTIKPEMWHAYILYNVKEAADDYRLIKSFCSEVIK